MTTLLRKLRGLAGLTALGAAAGALFGAAWGAVNMVLLGPGLGSPTVLIMIAVPWALIGAVSAGGLGLALATLDARKTLNEIPVARGAALGAAAGGAVTGLLLGATGGIPLGMLVSALAIGCGLGGGIGGSLLMAAKRADRMDDGSAMGALPDESGP